MTYCLPSSDRPMDLARQLPIPGADLFWGTTATATGGLAVTRSIDVLKNTVP
jgi:hypothetical protein